MNENLFNKNEKKIFVSVKHFNFEQARILIKYYLL